MVIWGCNKMKETYRVMIVDDEIAILKLLTKMIDWGALDMEVAGSAASGVEAINTIDDIRPDICFVDIQMPFMNGIDFSKIAKERYPDLKIVILSAFDEFSYARECIGIGVSEYLLKPIEKNKVTETLQRLRRELQEMRMQQTEDPCNEPAAAQEVVSVSDRVMCYINENYTTVDLNLSKVAQEFGFNASYLSRKFKKETGNSFTDYILRCRMERAKKLAGSDKPMYQVAIEIGVPDPNYFSKCFKRHVGMTYSEFVSKKTGA